MHKNYYIFKRQAEALRARLENRVIDLCYTARKDELVVCLGGEAGQLQISIRRDLPYLFFKPLQNIRAVHFKLFAQLNGQRIKEIEIVPCNKHIIIHTETFRLHVLFYGKFRNIYLTGPGDEILDTFKANRSETLLRYANETWQEFPGECCKKMSPGMEKAPAAVFLQTLCPAYNKLMQREVLERCSLSERQMLDNASRREKLFNVVEAFNRELNTGPVYLYEKEGSLKITLFKSVWLEKNGYAPKVWEDVNKAWPAYVGKTDYFNNYQLLYKQISAALEKRESQLKKALSKLAGAEDMEKRKELADMKGNILLSFKHKVPKGARQVSLKNIYSEEGEEISIRLNPRKTAAENAQIYFNKYKNLVERKEVLALKKENYRQEMSEIKALLEKTTKTSKIEQLKRIREELIARRLIQENSTREVVPEKTNLKFSFKRVILDKRWDVYIGKNDKNNDLLTFRFANKWDVWLHAQGVPGSHVVIKKQRKEEIIPKSIIEKAARLAAANSKSKHSGTVPVLYTEARYVNRIRKAPPGTVAVKNEQVLFVEPLNMNQI